MVCLEGMSPSLLLPPVPLPNLQQQLEDHDHHQAPRALALCLSEWVSEWHIMLLSLFIPPYVLSLSLSIIMGMTPTQLLTIISLTHTQRQWSGRFLGITGWNPSDYKSNRLHVHILRFSFVKLGVYYIDSSKMIGNFLVDFNFNWLFLKLNRFICN